VKSGSQDKGNANQTKEIRDRRSNNDPAIRAPCINKEILKGLEKATMSPALLLASLM
jgi:hypothetical protein